MRAIGRVGDLALVNVLFLFCSIPIVTLGASAAALYTVTFQMVRGEDRAIVKTFFSAFRRNFGQATLLTILFLLLGAGLYLDLRVMQANPAAFPLVFRIGSGLVAFAAAIALPYVFALQARFDNTVFKTLKNAFVLAVTHPLTSLLAALLTLLPLGLLLFAPYYLLLSSIFWFLFGFSLAAVAISWLFERMIQQQVSAAP
ncbi:MAG: DUF624 domain-containing protein [Eubacteriales bacterium]|nr:DUF624 domain-containing protein [Eubacteriales bacterium]